MMAFRISRAINRPKTTIAKASIPATFNPTETPIPITTITPTEINPIHSEHAAPNRISTLIEGL